MMVNKRIDQNPNIQKPPIRIWTHSLASLASLASLPEMTQGQSGFIALPLWHISLASLASLPETLVSLASLAYLAYLAWQLALLNWTMTMVVRIFFTKPILFLFFSTKSLPSATKT